MNPATTLRVAMAIQGADEARAPEVLLAEPAPDFKALRRHLRARVDSGDVLLVDADNRAAVTERIRELAVAGRDLPRVDLSSPAFAIPDVPMPDELPPNRAMRRGNLHAGHVWAYPVKKRR